MSCREGEQQGLGGGESSHPRCSGLLLGPPRALCPGGTQEQGRDLNISLPAADIEAESAFNVRAAENSSRSLCDLHLKGTGAPGPPACAQRSLAQLIPPAHPSAWLCCGAVVSRLLHAPRPEPVGIVGLLSWPGSVWPLASHGCPSSVTAASTGRSGWSWLEPQLR